MNEYTRKRYMRRRRIGDSEFSKKFRKKTPIHVSLGRVFQSILQRKEKADSQPKISRKAKDFSAGSKQRNPMTQFHQPKDWSGVVKRFAIIGFSIVGVYLLIYHPYLHVSSISISGNQRISTEELTALVENAIDSRPLFIFSGKHIFLVKERVIESILHDRYALEEIVVHKKFPHSLDIYIQEKITTIIYDNQEHISYLDIEGNVVETLRNIRPDEYKTVTINSSTERFHVPSVHELKEEYGPYPIVLDSRDKEKQHTIDSQILEYIIDWHTMLKKQADFDITYIEIDNSIYDAKIHTNDGWYVYVSLYDDPEDRMNVLYNVLHQEISIERGSISYIDIRFDETVFWK